MKTVTNVAINYTVELEKALKMEDEETLNKKLVEFYYNNPEALRQLIIQMNYITGEYDQYTYYINDFSLWDKLFTSPSEALNFINCLFLYNINDLYISTNGKDQAAKKLQELKKNSPKLAPQELGQLSCGIVTSTDNLMKVYTKDVTKKVIKSIISHLKADTNNIVKNLSWQVQRVLLMAINND